MMEGEAYKGVKGSNTAVNACLYPQSNLVSYYTYTNKIYRFAKIPFFDVAQGK